MHRVRPASWLGRAMRIGDTAALADVPVFLCPALLHSTRPSARESASHPWRKRLLHTEATAATTAPEIITRDDTEIETKRELPVTCSGCGSFVQVKDPSQFGYIDVETSRIKKWLDPGKNERPILHSKEDDIVQNALASMDKEKLEQLGLDPTKFIRSGPSREELRAHESRPLCDRCHNMNHHSFSGNTAELRVYHPSVESLKETLEESPHKYTHIYHVIDAADFPMSLIPRLVSLLGEASLRGRNRRSRSTKYQHDRSFEMSFVITRSDLLAPTKEQVDNMVPYLRDVLRDALGRLGRRVRLGNVHCVSASRGWWTSGLREMIWNRGGAGWMVGKVNVGKSSLFEAIYPKGRVNKSDRTDEYRDQSTSTIGQLLPPPQPMEQYPQMPTVSSLPGTTASPIRIPFGHGRGELIDMPGLARSDLELHVKEEHRQSLIMQRRIKPQQETIKPSQSLILGGGLVRITPRTPDMLFLMYNFTPLSGHVTHTDKAVAFQSQSSVNPEVENICVPEAGQSMKHVGTFQLSYDVTKRRAGPLTSKSALRLSVDTLPFRVLSLDVLIEGVGYVELVAQVRKRDWNQFPPAPQDKQQEDDDNQVSLSRGRPADPFEAMASARRDSGFQGQPPKRKPEHDWPAVDVFSPEGKFIGSRQPINGWLNNKPRLTDKHKKSRPRRSLKGGKKRLR